MKKVITLIAIVIAVAGVFVAKANDHKRVFGVAQAYFSDGTTKSLFIDASASQLITGGTAGQEASITFGSNSYALYNESGLTNRLYKQ